MKRVFSTWVRSGGYNFIWTNYHDVVSHHSNYTAQAFPSHTPLIEGHIKKAKINFPFRLSSKEKAPPKSGYKRESTKGRLAFFVAKHFSNCGLYKCGEYTKWFLFSSFLSSSLQKTEKNEYFLHIYTKPSPSSLPMIYRETRRGKKKLYLEH